MTPWGESKKFGQVNFGLILRSLKSCTPLSPEIGVTEAIWK